MCALAGVSSPDRYQQWELNELAKARQSAQWDQVAEICIAVLAPHTNRTQTWADFNPYRRLESEAGRGEMSKVANELIAEHGEPQTNEEKERLWGLLKERMDGN